MRETRYIAQAGVIAAVYGVLTLVVLQSPLGFGPVQLRLSEAVTAVALLTPAAIPGLWLGTFLANMYLMTQVGAVALLDAVFGSIGSLLGAVWTWRLRRRPLLALAGPVVTNALIVPAYLPLVVAGLGFYHVPIVGWDLEGDWLSMYLFGVVAVGAGQSLVVYGLGWPFARSLKRLGVGQGISAGDEGSHG